MIQPDIDPARESLVAQRVLRVTEAARGVLGDVQNVLGRGAAQEAIADPFRRLGAGRGRTCSRVRNPIRPAGSSGRRAGRRSFTACMAACIRRCAGILAGRRLDLPNSRPPNLWRLSLCSGRPEPVPGQGRPRRRLPAGPRCGAPCWGGVPRLWAAADRAGGVRGPPAGTALWR